MVCNISLLKKFSQRYGLKLFFFDKDKKQICDRTCMSLWAWTSNTEMIFVYLPLPPN